ncbi:MAG: NADH-quinone oxidoreductase subunit NuoG [Magnetovibrionaceae bacterium]
MPKLTIDGMEVEVEAGLTVLQACEQAGIEIPRFCYHERLSIAGNCRMCLVSMERAPKPVASCAMPVGEGMVIKTNTPEVEKMRKGVMEFLLINHPLDCPICDQGGECDLQDQAMAFGADQSRFKENKRAVKDKYLGPLIKTIMTRCIHCTRCIRFAEEVAGVPEMGATFRGENMEVGTYVEKALTSELSANMVDLCPVGALTSGPYAYNARPWELRKTESIDVFDALGCNIRVDARGNEVLRVLPRLNEDVNEEWISDKSRYAIDGLKRQRLDKPYVRKDGKLKTASWAEAFGAIKTALEGVDGSKIGAIAGDMVDVESMTALKDLLGSLGSTSLDCRQDGAKIGGGPRGSYLFNSGIAGIEEADAILIVGGNLRREAAVLNARILKRHRAGGVQIGLIGEGGDQTYPYTHLGTDASALKDLGDFAKVLKDASKPMVILSGSAITGSDGDVVLGLARKVAEDCGAVSDDWNGFNLVHLAASRVGGLDLGFLPGEGGMDVEAMLGGAQVIYALGADEVDWSRKGDAFVIYQGHHGDAGAMAADVILPGSAYTEKSGTYVNTEGRVQVGQKAVFAPGDAREDWAILRALSDVLGKTLPYDDLKGVRARMVELNPVFAETDVAAAGDWGDFGTADGELSGQPFVSPVTNFYMTDPISRVSTVMAECTSLFVLGDERKTGTDG